MARRRACHRLARRPRGGPAAHDGQPPALHTNPHLVSDPHLVTNPHLVSDAHQGTDDARSAPDASHHGAGLPDVDADHDDPEPHPDAHPQPGPDQQPDPDRDSHPVTEVAAANDGDPGADQDYPGRHADAAGRDEHPDAAAGPG
jgi:hypothetical protein